MSDNPTFQIPKDVIEPIIQAHVSRAVCEALSGREQLIDRAVTRILTQKVDDTGKPSTYGNAVPFVEWAMVTAIKVAVKEALQEEVGKHKAALKATIIKQLQRQNSPLVKKLVEAMTTGVIDAATSQWRLTVDVRNRD